METRTPFSPAPAKGWMPWSVLAPLLTVVFIVVPALPATLLLQRAGLADAQGDPVGAGGLILFLLVPFTATLAIVLAWVRFVERRPPTTIGLLRTRALGRWARGWVVGVAMVVLLVGAIVILRGFQAGAIAPAIQSVRALAAIGMLLLAFAVQASVEEVLFRGWLLSVVARRWSPAWAIAITSAVFALLHFNRGQHWLMTLNMLLFSVFTGIWALKADHIWGVMGWHAGWNWLLAVGFETRVTGVDAGTPALLLQLTRGNDVRLTGGAAGPEGSYLLTVIFAAGLLVLLRARRTVA